jgi:hypothetical protein
MSPARQFWVISALATLAFLALRSLPDTHCALLHADHRPMIVDGLEFCGVDEEANFYRPRDLRFPYALKVELPAADSAGREGRLVLTDEEGRPVQGHQLALSHTRLLHLHLRAVDRPWYVHLHPEPREDGSWGFALPAGFVAGAGHHAYVDFVPGRTGRVVLAEAVVPATASAPIGATVVAPPSSAPEVAEFSVSTHRTGESSWLRLRLRRPDGSPLKLRPLMGTLGHAVLFSAARTEAAMGYAHLHPSLEGGEYDPSPTLSFRLRLPKPGDYELWLHVDDGVDRYMRVTLVVTP